MTATKPPEMAADATADPPEGQTKATQRQEKRDDRARSRLREAEQERDALRGRVDNMLSAEVHRLLAERVTDPGLAMRALEKTPADFLNESGLVDAKRIESFAADVVERVPAFRRDRTPVADGTGMRNHSGRQRSGSPRYGWSDILSADPSGSG